MWEKMDMGRCQSIISETWVLGADIVSPAKPARRLSAHVSLFDKNKGDFSFL